MDNNFQTSFIPKKPLAEDKTPVVRHTSIFSFIATLLFFGSLASAAGMYFYKASLEKTIASDDQSVLLQKNSFEESLIKTLSRLDDRITDAKMLLGNHVAVTPIFEALQINTLKTIQFTKFSYTTPADPNAQVAVHMSGIASNYTAIAQQSDHLATNVNVHNSIFSNLTLNEKNGTVTFDLVFTVDPDLVRFKNHFAEITSQGSSSEQVPSAPIGGQTNLPTAPAAQVPTTPSGATQ